MTQTYNKQLKQNTACDKKDKLKHMMCYLITFLLFNYWARAEWLYVCHMLAKCCLALLQRALSLKDDDVGEVQQWIS